VCEQELLAIVHALQKVRVRVLGRRITVNTEHKALLFPKRCASASNPIARSVLQIQDYDLEIQHIPGGQNSFADILSRNPAGLSPNQITTLTKSRELLPANINLNIDLSIKKTQRDLGNLQTQDLELSGM
jgi:hypothetical protein